ncbi:hypothetical protein KC339_g91 [Hortaea werneckii]|nr:hypothetical protein KC339_g91 [Hortaea werneckii]
MHAATHALLRKSLLAAWRHVDLELKLWGRLHTTAAQFAAACPSRSEYALPRFGNWRFHMRRCGVCSHEVVLIFRLEALLPASHAAPSIGFESACRTPVARNRILNEERQERGQHFLDVAVQAAPGWALGGGHSPTCNMAGKK